jgi:tetratricopeptide (TPR) repeat protein
MKKTLFFLLFLCSISLVNAQRTKSDSIARLLATEKIDSNRVTLLWNMAYIMHNFNPDTALLLSQEALHLARKIKFRDGESRALGILANTFTKTGNYPQALEFYLEKLKIEEKNNYARSLASVIMNIGIVYVYQEEYRKALVYYRQADSIIYADNVEDLKYNIALNEGDLYNRLNITDSAFLFFNRSLGLAIEQEDGDLTGTSMTGLAHSFYKMNNDSLALKNYRNAITYLEAANDVDITCEASLGLAKVYERMGKSDSATFYAQKALRLAQKDGFLQWNLEAVTFLTAHYKQQNRPDSALAYSEQAQVLKNSINSKDRIRASQILSTNEQLRQREIAENKLIARKERSKQLQLLFIGMFIPGLFLLTLFLSRRQVHTKVIKTMGIISLLIFFEYLTLLLHPYVLELTHHTPVYEIIIFVCIAAILIPSHHKIEHWLIDKLTRKKQDDNLVLKRMKLKKKVE